jgi:hypothetical protein
MVTASELMASFAERSGLCGARPQRRYLWTDMEIMACQARDGSRSARRFCTQEPPGVRNCAIDLERRWPRLQ